MSKSVSFIARFLSLLLFGLALVGLIGHQLLTVPDTQVPITGAFLCAQDYQGGQQASADTAGCAVHTGYLITPITVIRFSPPITWNEERLDLTSPFQLAIPVPHPPA